MNVIGWTIVRRDDVLDLRVSTDSGAGRQEMVVEPCEQTVSGRPHVSNLDSVWLELDVVPRRLAPRPIKARAKTLGLIPFFGEQSIKRAW